ncbi:hypothetical protein V6Z11_1Z087300 [Gossypium hirsutum]
MVDLDWKAKMVSSISQTNPPKLSNKLQLRKLWETKEFPAWHKRARLKPALHALEITFRFISIVLSDPRSYSNRREWKRRLESLTTTLPRSGSFMEKQRWSAEPAKTACCLDLPRGRNLKTPRRKILYTIECEMRRCPYTLGLGEPNFPNDIHALKRSPYDHCIENHENATLFTTHQILESWIQTAKQVLKRIASRIDAEIFETAASDCYLMERIWKLLAEIEDLHLLMDPDDFLHLKSQLLIKPVNETEAFCFRSKGLVEITKISKELKHKVPFILGVEVDPKGGPRIQEAAMRLYSEKQEGNKVFLVQALQAIEGALKRFFYGYKQVLVVVMGSLEAKGNRVVAGSGSVDSLSQVFLEPAYFPSLDAAKTFLGEFWNRELGGSGLTRWKN